MTTTNKSSKKTETTARYFLNKNYGGLPEGTEFVPHPSIECLTSKEAFLGHYAYIAFDDDRIEKVLPKPSFEVLKPTESPTLNLSVEGPEEAYRQAANLASQGMEFTLRSPRTWKMYNQDNYEDMKEEMEVNQSSESDESTIDEDGYITHMVVEWFELKLNVDFFNNHLFYTVKHLLESEEVGKWKEGIYISPINGTIGYTIVRDNKSDEHAVCSGFVMPTSFDAKQIISHVGMLLIAYKFKVSAEEIANNVTEFLLEEGFIDESNQQDILNFMEAKCK